MPGWRHSALSGVIPVGGWQPETPLWRGLADARRRQAEIARAAGDLDHAEEYLRAAWSLYLMLNNGYWAARALSLLAEIQLDMGDSLAAAELSGQAVEQMPGDTEALTVLALAEWQAGSPADAEVTFSRVLHWDADAPSALAGADRSVLTWAVTLPP